MGQFSHHLAGPHNYAMAAGSNELSTVITGYMIYNNIALFKSFFPSKR